MRLCSFHSDKELLGLENQSNKFKLWELIGKIQEILFESVALLPPRPHVKWKTDSFSICISLRLIFSSLPFFLPLHLSVFLFLFLLSLSLFLSSIPIFYFLKQLILFAFVFTGRDCFYQQKTILPNNGLCVSVWCAGALICFSYLHWL